MATGPASRPAPGSSGLRSGASLPNPSSASAEVFAPFAAIFGAILAVGLLVAFVVMRQLPRREALVASAPAPATPPPQQVTGNTEQLPAGHPSIQLPKEARDFIASTEQKAEANPKDIATWDRYGDVCLRAATLDATYYPKASAAYAHVLALDPDNLDALRGVGNIDFDQRKYDEAVAAYEHYLAKNPSDPDVRTDLGTMLLSSGSADQAVLQYNKVLESHPSFFEANFNLGIAYGQMNQIAEARAAFERAAKVAPDADAKNRVNQMLAEINSNQGGTPSEPGQVAENAPPSAAPTGGTFHDAMEQMLRDLPIAGPKVSSVQWSSTTNARVMMDNFPMDQMPPFAASKFMSDLKAGIGQVKSSHKINGPVQVDICDAASGRVMKSVTE